MRIMLWDGDRYPFVSTLESFLESNTNDGESTFTADELKAITEAATRAGAYHDPGGASAPWSLLGDPRCLPSMYDAPDAHALGWGLFWVGASLKDMRDDDERRGWWGAWAHCYAQGYADSKNPPKDGGLADMCDPNPYPQFSGAWEAWGSGWNDATALFHDSFMLAEVGDPEGLTLACEADRVVLASDLRDRIASEAQEGEPLFDVMRWLVDALAFVLAAPLGQVVAFPNADVARVVRSSLEV